MMTLALLSASASNFVEDDWLKTALQRPGMLASLAMDEDSRVLRVLRTMTLARVIELADGAGAAEAAGLYKSWLGLNGASPTAYVIWFNLGVTLAQLGDKAQAAVAYENALAIKPDLHEAMINLGLAREALGRHADAIAIWRGVLPSDENRRLAHMHLGRMLEERGDLEVAAEELRAALLIDSDQPDILQHWLHMRQRMAIWPVFDASLPGVTIETQARNCGPLAALALHGDPALQTEMNAAWIARKLPPAPERLAPAEGYGHSRIRIGYLSSDYCRHAMSFLVAELMERHDRGAFEVYGYCASPEDGSDVRARLVAAFDYFVRIADIDDQAAARRIRADEIDILVDLNGLTKGGRLGVLRWKPAPVQVTYLGYVGPVPIPELDYMICDDVTVPPEEAGAYLPRPLPLAGCYQANDGSPMELPAVSRRDEGLPEDAFVYCSFSNHYKITPEMFDAWLSILERAPTAVLWLVQAGPASQRNLTARWLARGLAPERLVFAARVDPARYRARMALADLFLDTTPYNAGTVASDALRMGLPLLTVAGRAYAARMATSLLTAVGMPECVASDMNDYIERAVALAEDPGLHAALKGRLAGDAWARTLGDTASFTRRLEDAYRGVLLPRSPAPAIGGERTDEPIIRFVVATRESRDEFFTKTSTGRSYALYGFPSMQISLYENNIRSLAEIYNLEIEKSIYKPAILMFIHDDVCISDYWWVAQIKEALTQFDMVGLVGNRRRVPSQPSWAFLDANGTWDVASNLSGVVGHGSGFPPRTLSVYGAPCQEVKLLDGLMLVADSETLIKNDIRFDERFSFHFYDLDICRQFERKGLKMGTWRISVIHESAGNYASENWLENYRLYLDKWSD